jgi:hypothetical protein
MGIFKTVTVLERFGVAGDCFVVRGRIARVGNVMIVIHLYSVTWGVFRYRPCR